MAQGCQMVYFQTKNAKLDKFWRAFDWKILIYFMATWNILQTFGIFYRHLEYFTDIWNILQTFGIFYRHLEHVMTIWYILCSFGTFFPGLASCIKKNLATLKWFCPTFFASNKSKPEKIVTSGVPSAIPT
jgi:hypothetical protein